MSVVHRVKSANPKIATVEYYSSDTCSHCRKFDPIFAGLMTGCLPTQGVEFVQIDVTPKKDGGAAAKQSGITQFPTIRLTAADGQTMTYPPNMPRDHDNMSLWLIKALTQLQNAGAMTQRAGDPYMDQQASLHGNDRVNAWVPGRFVYGRNNTNVKYRKSENTCFQDHRDRMRRDASKYNLSFNANAIDAYTTIRNAYDSAYQEGQDVPLGIDHANYATINFAENGNIGYNA